MILIETAQLFPRDQPTRRFSTALDSSWLPAVRTLKSGPPTGWGKPTGDASESG